MALANVCAALTEGIRKFDSCIGGLGGCPFAPGAAGNLATEDLANMLYQMGFVTNVHLEKLPKIVDFHQIFEDLGGIWEASGKHLGGIWEASGTT